VVRQARNALKCAQRRKFIGCERTRALKDKLSARNLERIKDDTHTTMSSLTVKQVHGQSEYERIVKQGDSQRSNKEIQSDTKNIENHVGK
jgi:hypothetical protein